MKKILTGFTILSIFSLIILLSGCNKDDEKISSGQIRQAMFDMKGTYHGSLEVAYYHGSGIAGIDNAKAVSRDSLAIIFPLAPLANTIDDKNIAAALLNIENVEVRAGYEFIQIDNDGSLVNFVLNPKTVTIPANGDTPEIKIIFDGAFGGDFEKAFNFIMFNISPEEILVGGTKLESFKQLVYHFRGQYE